MTQYFRRYQELTGKGLMRNFMFACASLAFVGTAQAQTALVSSEEAANRLVSTNAAAPLSLADVNLGDEFPQLKGFRFTQNLYTIAPGAGRAMHSHAGAPEIVHILSGTLTDARNGGSPITYGPGSTLLNINGTTHMWANLGSEPVIFLATSIKSPAGPQSRKLAPSNK